MGAAPGLPLQGRRIERAPLRNRRFLLTILVLLVAAAAWIVWPYLTAVVFALVLGYLLHPLYRYTLRVVRLEWIAAGLMLLLVAAALTAPLAYLGYRFVTQADEIQESLGVSDGYRDELLGAAERLGLEREQAEPLLEDATRQAAGALGGLVLDVARGIPTFVVGLVIFFILLYFVLVHGERFVAWFHEYAPLSRRRRTKLLQQVGRRVRAIMLGTFFISALQGVSAGLGWWFFGFPAPVFWGFVMVVLAVLPFLGAQMVTIPAGLIAIARGDTFAGVGLIVYTLIVVSLIDDLVRPWVIGKQSGVHPALILVGTLGGLHVFGVAGLVLGPLLLGLIEPVLRTWADASGPPPERDAGPQPPPAPSARAPRRLPPAS